MRGIKIVINKRMIPFTAIPLVFGQSYNHSLALVSKPIRLYNFNTSGKGTLRKELIRGTFQDCITVISSRKGIKPNELHIAPFIS